MSKAPKIKIVEKEVLTKPRKVGPYRVLQEVGRGGMAVVYRGVHEPLQREVALKELLPSVADLESNSRFRREALALAAFRHQNIVTLYDLVEKNDSLYMVMEFVDGPTLAELLKTGPLPAPVAAVIGARVASALDHAHFSHIIHRDIKPSNIMVTKTGEVKLMDFGIAKDAGLEALTRKGIAVGTPSYMSPEQVMGTEVDARTDVWSLGVVLYECLTGVKPFTGANAGEVFAKVRDGKFNPVRRATPGVPRALEKIVHRALRVSLNRRYPTAASVRRDCELFLGREVGISHQALLVAFLRQRGKLTETEALARVTTRELQQVAVWDAGSSGGGVGLRWALAVGALALGSALYATHSIWMPLLSH